MRIVIDLQSVQAESKYRGIGRYSLSLALAMVRNRGSHEVLIALNGLFPDTILPIREMFKDILPQHNIRVWGVPAPVSSLASDNVWRRKSAELVREAFLASLKPDIVHISSLFEGLSDNAVTSIGTMPNSMLTVVTLYDLIPLIYRKPYLENPILEAWYLEKVEYLRRADLLLSISESSLLECVDELNFPISRIVNISSDADEQFIRSNIPSEQAHTLRKKYSLRNEFLMYTGGIDHRKNIDNLIRAYASLSQALRDKYQLAIVCNVQLESRAAIEKLASQVGLNPGELILTGYVPEEDLIALYNLCALFVFPSLHEGFGLPVLEAMRCGAAVIGSNTASLPEVIGWAEALFDPRSVVEIAAAIERALTDTAFHVELVANGVKQSSKFSWDESAKRSIIAMEQLYVKQCDPSNTKLIAGSKPKLAYVSPLPPEKSGIADYSAELLPALANFYEIAVIVCQKTITDEWINDNCSIRSIKWFTENADTYDRVIYQFGNSEFHEHMFELINIIPGVIVLHDFYLSGITHHMDVFGNAPHFWDKELYYSHGYSALSKRLNAKDNTEVIWEYPCSLSVIQKSLGVITHSENSVRLAKHWYGCPNDDWQVIPLVRNSEIRGDKTQARKALGLSTDSFIVCTFGMIGPSKLSHRLLQSWSKTELAADKDCHLIFVGENHPGQYGDDLLNAVRNSPKANIHVVGWTTQNDFRQYLAAADLGVQLRTLSRGETSAAVLDCMNYGLATIVNANGSMADLADNVVYKLPNEFTDVQLSAALDKLWKNETLRRELGHAARESIILKHNPETCATKFRTAIEQFYSTAACVQTALPRAIAEIKHPYNQENLIALADDIARNFPLRNRQYRIFLDISDVLQADKIDSQTVLNNFLIQMLNVAPYGYRIEPVYLSDSDCYRYAHEYILGLIKSPILILQDEIVDFVSGDVFVGIDLQLNITDAKKAFYKVLRIQGLAVKFAMLDLLKISEFEFDRGIISEEYTEHLEVLSQSDGVFCLSKTVFEQLSCMMKNKIVGLTTLNVDNLKLVEDFKPTLYLGNHTDDLALAFQQWLEHQVSNKLTQYKR